MKCQTPLSAYCRYRLFEREICKRDEPLTLSRKEITILNQFESVCMKFDKRSQEYRMLCKLCDYLKKKRIYRHFWRISG